MDWNTRLDSTFSDLFSRRNLALLVLFWSAGLGVFVVYGTRSARRAEIGNSFLRAVPAPAGNQTGAFLAWRDRSPTGCKPAFRVAFDNLRANNNSVGLFRTALHKVIHIDNLRIEFSHAPTARDADEEADLPFGGFYSLFAPRTPDSSEGASLGLFEQLRAETKGWSVAMDLSNTTEVQIRHLDWQVHRGADPVFAARCLRASLQLGSPYVVLRGHATVTIGETTLESGCIRLDMHKERMIVDGRYVLTRDGSRQFGAGACFNTELEPFSDRS